MIRKATAADIAGIVDIYERILEREDAGLCQTGWVRGVYPTEATATEALRQGTLFVCEENGSIAAAAKIDHAQAQAYADCSWAYEADDEQIMVLHTLVVDPEKSGLGWGKRFMAFYESYALRHGCTVLRMDTNARNAAARRLYAALGFREASIVNCDFNGIGDVALVCLEKKLASV